MPVCAICEYPGAEVLDRQDEQAVRVGGVAHRVLVLYAEAGIATRGKIRQQLVFCPRCAKRDPEKLGTYLCYLPPPIVTAVRVRRRKLRSGS
jgi:hypothetical protein